MRADNSINIYRIMKVRLIILLTVLGVVLSLKINTEVRFIAETTADSIYVNPNGTSELASLMREMQIYSGAEREKVIKGSLPSPMPDRFSSLKTAAISQGMEKSEMYDTFANLYMGSVKDYIGSDKKVRVEKYNNMIASCIACHSQHCPGPVPVIKKLTIKN